MSIADELALLASTKENLRVSLGLSKDVPFSQYASHIPYYAKVGTVFDFVNNQYSRDQLPVNLSDISDFIRLSSATKWQDGQLVEVGDNIPRISGDGLFIEKSSTELIPNNSSLTSTNTAWTATQKTDAQIGSVFEFISDGSETGIRTNVPIYPNGNVSPNSGYYYRCILAKKTSADSFLVFGSDWGPSRIKVNLKNGSLVYEGSDVAKIKISDIGEYYLLETVVGGGSTVMRQWRLFASNNRGTGVTLAIPTAGHKVTIAFPSFRDTADFPQSIIKTTGVQSTRAKEALVIPFVAGQTVTADKDEGVTMTIVDNNAVFEGRGYIRSIEVS